MENIVITKPSLKHYIVLTPLFLILKLWLATLRFRYTPSSEKIIIDSRRGLFLAWHNRIFFLYSLKRMFRRNLPMTGLVSASRDGAWLAAFFDLCSIGTVRGSYNRRGAGAVRDLVKELEISDIAITPDGPRGPVHQAKRGFLTIAKISKVRVVLLRLRPRNAIKLTCMWDSFAIPLPFSRVDLDCIEYENYEQIEKLSAAENMSPDQFISRELLYL